MISSAKIGDFIFYVFISSLLFLIFNYTVNFNKNIKLYCENDEEINYLHNDATGVLRVYKHVYFNDETLFEKNEKYGTFLFDNYYLYFLDKKSKKLYVIVSYIKNIKFEKYQKMYNVDKNHDDDKSDSCISKIKNPEIVGYGSIKGCFSTNYVKKYAMCENSKDSHIGLITPTFTTDVEVKLNQ